jgi:lipopolysaccharide/colanic/teichoic acid biosynthesis glycosyltransferase
MRAKRAFDILGALVLLVLASPVMLLSALAIRLEDRGPALFKQTRVGKGGELFTIFKFRTMVRDAELMQLDLTNDHEGPVFKMRGDPRITHVGRLLRKTSMDELPQLFNIVRGDMSLVGPRPLPVHEVDAAPASFLDRQAVKPGLTGRWQVSGRSDTGFDELDELDRWYVDNWSLGQDLEILARTVPAVLLARGAR